MLCVHFIILVVPQGIMGNSVVAKACRLMKWLNECSRKLYGCFRSTIHNAKLNNIHNGSLITINISDSLTGTPSTWRKSTVSTLVPFIWARLVNPIIMSWLESWISQTDDLFRAHKNVLFKRYFIFRTNFAALFTQPMSVSVNINLHEMAPWCRMIKNATPLSEVPEIQLANEINRSDEWLNTDEKQPDEIRHVGNAAYIKMRLAPSHYSLLIIAREHHVLVMNVSLT